MTDNWFEFWKNSPLSDTNGMNLRPDTYDVKKAVRHINSFLNIKEHHSILDVGCGNGLTLKVLSEFTKNLYGCDVSKNMVSLVNKKYHVPAFVSTADKLPFADESFDRVICMAVMQYYSDIESARKAVKDMYRVCRPGGIMLIGDIPDARVLVSKSGIFAFTPAELGNGFGQSLAVKSFYESERRFDLIIKKL